MIDVPLTDKVALSVTEAGALLGLSRTKVYELVAAGLLRPIPNVTPRRIARADVDRFATAHLEVA